MATGLSVEAAAAKIGISARSLFYWQREHRNSCRPFRKAGRRLLLWWEERALALANGEPGNTQIVSLALKNRSRAAHGWNNEALQIEHKVTTEPAIEPSTSQ
jgi:hypothetical protein